MTWYILMIEGLLIVAIIVWMVKKLKAIRKNNDEEQGLQQKADEPGLELPDEEKWE